MTKIRRYVVRFCVCVQCSLKDSRKFVSIWNSRIDFSLSNLYGNQLQYHQFSIISSASDSNIYLQQYHINFENVYIETHLQNVILPSTISTCHLHHIFYRQLIKRFSFIVAFSVFVFRFLLYSFDIEVYWFYFSVTALDKETDIRYRHMENKYTFCDSITITTMIFYFFVHV